MNGYAIAIVDPVHAGCRWISPAPFVIETSATTVTEDAPVVVHLLGGTQPDRAAALLREVADALDRNGRVWLPDLVQDPNRPDSELREHLDRLAQDPYTHLAEIIAFEDGEHYPEVMGACNYRDKTPRGAHSPTVRLEVACGASPKEVLALLACITASLKERIKKEGADFARTSKPVWQDDGEVPF